MMFKMKASNTDTYRPSTSYKPYVYQKERYVRCKIEGNFIGKRFDRCKCFDRGGGKYKGTGHFKSPHRAKDRCYKCRQFGHYAKNCPEEKNRYISPDGKATTIHGYRKSICDHVIIPR